MVPWAPLSILSLLFVRRICITKKGVSLLERSLPLWQKAQDEVVGGIGPREWEGLLSGLHKVAKYL
jgi:hypothetical protein